jgi:hypothetical protein
VFEVFNAPHSGDFSGAKFFRYRAFDSAVSEGVLARYDDGVPALVERRNGSGRVLVWTSTLDTFWNDLARQPVFLPFMHQLVKHAASYAEASSWHTVGEVLDVDRYLAMVLEDDSEDDASGRAFDLVVTALVSENHPAADRKRALLPLEEQGFYDIRRAGTGRRFVLERRGQSGYRESDLSARSEELVASVTFRETGAPGSGSARRAIAGRRRKAGKATGGFSWRAPFSFSQARLFVQSSLDGALKAILKQTTPVELRP